MHMHMHMHAHTRLYAHATGMQPHRDQSAVKNLVSGVTRMRRRLDYVLSKLTERNMSTVEPVVRQVSFGCFTLLRALFIHLRCIPHRELLTSIGVSMVPCGYVSMVPCGYVSMVPCGYVSMVPCGYASMVPCGYVAQVALQARCKGQIAMISALSYQTDHPSSP